MKHLLAVLVSALAVGAMGVTVAQPAQADPAGYYYKCDTTSMGGMTSISFNELWGCPMGVIRQFSYYNGKQVNWISGLCANQEHIFHHSWTGLELWNYCNAHRREW